MNCDAEKTALTVSSLNQVSKYVFAESKERTSPRVLFVGNSVTMHARKEDIGWFGDWGMAASCMEKDYVHRVMAALRKVYPDATFRIAQGAIWEIDIEHCDYDGWFRLAREFAPDVLYFALGANTPKDEHFNAETFKRCMGTFIDYLTGENPDCKVVIGGDYWINATDAAVKEFAEEHSLPFVPLSDILLDDAATAKGLFEHAGVQGHPGDTGMERIAQRIVPAIERVLRS